MIRVGDFIKISDKDGNCGIMKVKSVLISEKDCLGMYETRITGRMASKDFFGEPRYVPKSKKVIFAPPATIVYWEDGSRTVVKCDDRDLYNRYTGLAMCYMKKALGNSSRKLNDILREEIDEK